MSAQDVLSVIGYNLKRKSFIYVFLRVSITKYNMHFSALLDKHDIMLNILSYLCNRPFHLIILYLSSKHALLSMDPMWEILFEHILMHQRALKKSRYFKALVYLQNYLRIPKTVSVVFGKACQICGAHTDHRLVKALHSRICKSCAAQNFISNGTLFFEYGISFIDVVRDYSEGGGIIIPASHLKRIPVQRITLSSAQYQHAKFKDIIFFGSLI